jgi:hypothetical protein
MKLPEPVKSTSYIKFLITLLTLSSDGFAKDKVENQGLEIDLPILDFPFVTKAIKTGQVTNSFSMEQSLAITQNFHNINYYFNNKIWKKIANPSKSKKAKFWNTVGANLSAGAIDYLFTYHGVVFSPQWLHEEFHRNGMTIRNIKSYNETYNRFKGGYANGSISKVSDADLMRFKHEAPDEMVRSFEAGIESEYLLIRNMQKDAFFKKANYPNILLTVLLTNHAIGYVNQFKHKDYDHSIDLMNKHSKDISDRDFVGWDFTPWVYDLFRPKEPYADRGTHPSGIGIDRAIKSTKLTNEEYQYLEKMGKMQYLNFLSPFMLGIDRIRLTSRTEFNFALRHFLTSFGYNLTSDFFIRHNEKNYLISLHRYTNNYGSYPGVAITIPSYRQKWKDKSIELEHGAMLWMQPINFYSTSAQTGAQLSTKIHISLNNWLGYYISADGKSRGWVAGNPYLKDNFILRFGLKATIP